MWSGIKERRLSVQGLRVDRKILKAFASWSGGKESALALYRAKIKGIKILYLLNMLSEDGRFSRSHRPLYNILKIQAEGIGIPLIQCKTSWEDYEEKFKKKISELKREGIEAGIFGDIDLQPHRDWVEKVCGNVGIKPVLPLWKEKRERLLKDFIQAGFKAIVVTTRADILDSSWLGRQTDEKFIEDLKGLDSIDLCGERGEYHTFVFKGPIFKKEIKFNLGKKIFKGNFCFLEIKAV
jgi:uncharacterized protein (TIGR00290 family)